MSYCKFLLQIIFWTISYQQVALIMIKAINYARYFYENTITNSSTKLNILVIKF